MIDTDKYEGHTPAKKWKVNQYCEESLGLFYLAGTTNPNRVYEECLHCGLQRDGLSQQVFDGRMSEEEVVKLCERDSVNQKLMQDAPLLLAEVKRLQDKLSRISDLAYEVVESEERGNEVLLEIHEVVGE